MNNQTSVETQFLQMANARHASGIPMEKAKLVSLVQLIRRACEGLADKEAVRQLAISEETRWDRAAEEAAEVADAALNGEPVRFAPRDFSYKNRPAQI